MRMFLKFFLPSLLSFGLTTVSIAADLPEESSVPGALVRAIPVALTEFERTRLSLDQYEVVIYEEGQAIMVVFLDPKRPDQILGSSPNMREYTVVLDKQTLQVLESYYMR